jgi:DNA-binding response OmpR family regulator
VILYDTHQSELSWRDGVPKLLAAIRPAFLILVSSAAEDSSRTELLDMGGYDIIRKPVQLNTLVHVMDGCWRLIHDLDDAASVGAERARLTFINDDAPSMPHSAHQRPY